MKKIFYSIIIPIKNQEKTIQNNLIKLIKKIKKINFLAKWEIILIDDGSTDKTLDNILRFKRKYRNIKIARNLNNRGKGYSIKKGIKLLNKNSQKVIIIDADLPYMDTFNKFISNLNTYDLVILIEEMKSELIKKKKIFIFNRIVGYFLNLIFRIFGLTSLKDTQAGLKGFDSSYKKIFNHIKTNGFLYDLEFLLILEKKKIYPKLIPCTYSVSEKSSINFKFDIYKKVFLDLLKIISNNFKNKYYLKKF